MNYRLQAVACALFAVATSSGARAQYACNGVSEVKNQTFTSVVVASGLTQPDFLTSPPGDTNRIFILQRGGVIQIHKRGQPTATLTKFLDITSKVNSTQSNEMGLLGLAFDPDYATTRTFWIYYSEFVSSQVYSVIARYQTTAGNPDQADAASEVRVLRIAKPESNHNGGMLAFGPDGFLYVFTGDGGGGGDAHGTCGNGQDRTVLLAKVLRLDVRGIDPASTLPDCGAAGANYRVPSSNPFNDGVGVGLCDEIWAYGVRNPWRSTFDAVTGDLYIADVGQSCWEEVNWAPAGSSGQNYGWRQMEGVQCYNSAAGSCTPPGAVCGTSPACQDASLTLPVTTYSHAAGACSITGGYAYRGCRMPNYRGTYFYGDYCAGFVKTLYMLGGVAVNAQDITSQVAPGSLLAGNLSSFGVDGQGELFALALNGFAYKIVPTMPDLEVSARGAADMLRLDKTGDWTWENLFLATEVPISFYRVYRGTPGGAYSCVFKTTGPSWPAGGDPAGPAPDQLFAYIVTAVNATGSETKTGTTGTFNAATCP